MSKLNPIRTPDIDHTSDNTESINTQYHYVGKSSLYKFAEEWKLNSYEFDILKRIVRCRHKGHFVEDLTKTKDLINIYLTEYLDPSE